MNSVDYRAQEYGTGESQGAVALVAGFDGRISEFEKAAIDLVGAGNDVVVYEYGTGVLLAGDPELLPDLAASLSADFLERTKYHLSHRYAGASLGGGIGWNMQKDCANAYPGIYAGVGADTARLVMSNPMFRKVVQWAHKKDPGKEFALRGYTEADLRVIWQQLHEPPDTGFMAVLGGLDYIIRRSEVEPKFEQWSLEKPINWHVMKRLGHSGIIKWFTENTPVMLELAHGIG